MSLGANPQHWWRWGGGTTEDGAGEGVSGMLCRVLTTVPDRFKGEEEDPTGPSILGTLGSADGERVVVVRQR